MAMIRFARIDGAHLMTVHFADGSRAEIRSGVSMPFAVLESTVRAACDARVVALAVSDCAQSATEKVYS